MLNLMDERSALTKPRIPDQRTVTAGEVDHIQAGEDMRSSHKCTRPTECQMPLRCTHRVPMEEEVIHRSPMVHLHHRATMYPRNTAIRTSSVANSLRANRDTKYLILYDGPRSMGGSHPTSSLSRLSRGLALSANQQHSYILSTGYAAPSINNFHSAGYLIICLFCSVRKRPGGESQPFSAAHVLYHIFFIALFYMALMNTRSLTNINTRLGLSQKSPTKGPNRPCMWRGKG